MNCFDLSIRPAGPEDFEAIQKLHAEAFGPGRFARTAYRIREAAGGASFGFVARKDGELVGSVHFTPVVIGGRTGALLLGPLAVAPKFKARGCGMKLVSEGVIKAKEMGFALVILVGDLPYYRRMGFEPVPPGRITLPGPVDAARILALETLPGSLALYEGEARGCPAPREPVEKAARPRQASRV